MVRLAQRAVSGAVRVELGVALREPSEAGAPLTYSFLSAGAPGADWSTADVRLNSLGTGTIHGLAVRLTGSGAVKWRLGGLLVQDAQESVAAPTGLKVDKASGDGQFRLSWQGASGRVRQYELHRVLADGTRRYLTGTCANAAYLKGLTVEQGEREIRFEVRSVGELYSTSATASTTHAW